MINATFFCLPKAMRILQCFLLIVLMSSITQAQNIFSVKTNQKIWEAKDRNDIVFTKNKLKKGNAGEKVLTLKGLYSWYDTSLRKPLIKLAIKGKPEVRIAALGAIGQSKDSSFIPYLQKIIKKSKRSDIKQAALISLGKCITNSQKSVLIELKFSNEQGYAECFYRALLKGINDQAFTDKIIELLDQKNENLFYAAWFLARTSFVLNASNYSKVAQILTDAKLSGLSADVSIPLMISLGKAKLSTEETAKVGYILNTFLKENNKTGNNSGELEAVSAMRALALAKISATDSILGFTKSKSFLQNPSLEVSLSEWLTRDCNYITEIPEMNYSPALVNLSRSSTCKQTSWKFTNTGTFYDKIWKMQTMEKDYSLYPQIKNMLLQSEEAAVKTAATESLIKNRMNPVFPDNLIEDFMRTLTILIKDGDEGVLSVIANAFLDKNIKPEAGYDSKVFSDLFTDAKSKLSLPGEMEALIDIEKVLALFNNTKYTKPIAEWNHPIDWNYIAKIPAAQRIKVTTTKGTFIIKLNVNEAPASVGSILQLVDKGFYDGKFFHRLVPNFVIQGGCPRGDGYGSADYTIRSEFSTLKYTPGAVGLASSGQDTEGCQWFVSHCPTPHLDGRYTIIGYVIEGMYVVHQLGVGDRMLKVERF